MQKMETVLAELLGDGPECEMPARPSGTRILAQGVEVSNDTWVTQLNNNDLIVGPTGSGKTRYYVKPNLLQMNESVIVADTKGSLRREVGPVLRDAGYRVIDIDFTDVGGSYGYNPLDFVHRDGKTGELREQDIMKICATLVPIENTRDPFWDFAARNLLACLLGFLFERVVAKEHNLTIVAKMLGCMESDKEQREETNSIEGMLDQHAADHPDSFTALKWMAFRTTTGADKMYASILGILSEKLDPFTFGGARRMFEQEERIDFKELGRRKCALFLTVSDTDRSLDRLVNLLYTQALQELCEYADKSCEGCALPVPVRLYLDDFATNCRIPDFDKVISVIRSRNIAVSVVLQSITQLETLYTHADAMTIVNGCDHLLYLGGQDLGTAKMMAEKADKPLGVVLGQGLDEAWLFERGARARLVRRFDLTTHKRYGSLPEARSLRSTCRDFRASESEGGSLGV